MKKKSNHRGTRAYRIWQAMLNRCRNPNVPCYEYYGGRGIRVCDSWRTFDAFLADMGQPGPDMTIDRIKTAAFNATGGEGR